MDREWLSRKINYRIRIKVMSIIFNKVYILYEFGVSQSAFREFVR